MNLDVCAFHCFQFLGFGSSFCLLQSPLLAIGHTGNCWPKNCKTRRLLFVAVFNFPEEFIACFMNVYVCLGKAFCWAGGLFPENVAALSCMHK